MLSMIIRNVNDEEVMNSTYIAHGGAVVQMILGRPPLKVIDLVVAPSAW
jgi:hypothetical protein